MPVQLFSPSIVKYSTHTVSQNMNYLLKVLVLVCQKSDIGTYLEQNTSRMWVEFANYNMITVILRLGSVRN